VLDEAIVDAFAAFPSLDQMLDFASQVIARWSDRGKACGNGGGDHGRIKWMALAGAQVVVTKELTFSSRVGGRKLWMKPSSCSAERDRRAG